MWEKIHFINIIHYIVVDLTTWQAKITEEKSTEYEDESVDVGETVEVKGS